jgi:adenylate kinase
MATFHIRGLRLASFHFKLMSMPQTFILIGRSGCGKGTQADLLAKYLNEKEPNKLYYLETGDKFREFFARENFSSSLSREISEKGGLQPEFLAVWVWSTALVENLDDKMHLIIDGSPRKLHEAHILDSALKFYNRHDTTVIFLDVSRKWSEERMRSRKRSDDINEEDVKRRLDWYDSDVVPVIAFFRDNPDYRFYEINGERPIEEIQAEIRAKIENETDRN